MKRLGEIATLLAISGCFAVLLRQMPVDAAAHDGLPSVSAAQAASSAGEKLYADNCAICHGDHREGNLPAFPPLVGIEHQMSDAQMTDLIVKGKDRMPPFPNLQAPELTALVSYLHTPVELAVKAPEESKPATKLSPQAEAGEALFQQNCAFCHGRDTMGRESGPDLTRSRLVRSDVNGDKISEVVRDGRPEKKMPAFNFSAPEVQSLAAFIHAEAKMAANTKGGRRGVDVADLQTGNAEAGKQYFNGPGGCVKCHSATDDLAGLANRLEGLALEERMLYPRDSKSTVTVTLPSGKQMAGTLAYLDEFTVGLKSEDGTYHSWLVDRVKYKVNSPVEAHVDQFSKYTDADVHNLMAYLQTLK
jgi:mono/diheme cytochrome c family protein